MRGEAEILILGDQEAKQSDRGWNAEREKNVTVTLQTYLALGNTWCQNDFTPPGAGGHDASDETHLERGPLGTWCR